MIKAIFWDNDGVLVDTERLYFRATQQVLATVGIPLTTAQYIDLFLVQGTGAWHLAAEHGLSPSAIEQLRHERNTLYSTLLGQEPLLVFKPSGRATNGCTSPSMPSIRIGPSMLEREMYNAERPALGSLKPSVLLDREHKAS